MSTESSPPPRAWSPLNARERRVLGVLIEKQKTTPDNYPMSLAAVVSGCNQKSNRDPVSSYEPDDVETTLDALRHKGATLLYEGSGRVPKWKHTLYEWLNLKNRPAELAVMAELLLRGPQTEGELRARASRMDPIPDLSALEQILARLHELDLVVTLTPPGQRRGVIVTHALYPPEELERLRERFAHGAPEPDDEPAARGSTAGRSAALAEEVQTLRADLDNLRQVVETLQADLDRMKEALGA